MGDDGYVVDAIVDAVVVAVVTIAGASEGGVRRGGGILHAGVGYRPAGVRTEAPERGHGTV